MEKLATLRKEAAAPETDTLQAIDAHPSSKFASPASMTFSSPKHSTVVVPRDNESSVATVEGRSKVVDDVFLTSIDSTSASGAVPAGAGGPNSPAWVITFPFAVFGGFKR